MTLFSDQQLQALIEDQQLDPRNGSHAVVVTANAQGAQVLAAMTFHGGKSTWEIQGIGQVDSHAKFSGQARVVVQW